MLNRKRIYFDNAATTTMRPEALDAMTRLLERGAYNPSSPHAEGRAARAALDCARQSVARTLDCPRRSVIFTGSGSEADNLAIFGVAKARRTRGRHIVSSVVEHHAVLHALDVLRDDGHEVTLLPVDQGGRVSVAGFAAALCNDTALATIMLANNETGALQPVRQLAAIARQRGVPFHTDAIQAPAWLDVRPALLGVDLLSLSGHKFCGPKGTGVLYIAPDIELAPMVHGGGQEYGRRAGTEDVGGATAFAVALELAGAERDEAAGRIGALRDRFEQQLRGAVADVEIFSCDGPRLPNISCVSFAGVDSEALLARLDLEGIAASAGSACTTGALEPSHVLAALGLDERWLRGVIRFSLGTRTTAVEIDGVLAVLPGIIADLRESVGSAAYREGGRSK